MMVAGKTNWDFQNACKPLFDQRTIEAQALGKQIKSTGFGKDVLNFNCTLDCEKMVCAGYSMGGWTAILACVGDQDVFKCSMSFDPSHFQH